MTEITHVLELRVGAAGAAPEGVTYFGIFFTHFLLLASRLIPENFIDILFIIVSDIK